MKKLEINDIVNLLPTEEEIEKEAKSFEDSPMMSIAESVIYPGGFRDGAKWVIEQIEKKVKNEK